MVLVVKPIACAEFDISLFLVNYDKLCFYKWFTSGVGVVVMVAILSSVAQDDAVAPLTARRRSEVCRSALLSSHWKLRAKVLVDQLYILVEKIFLPG